MRPAALTENLFNVSEISAGVGHGLGYTGCAKPDAADRIQADNSLDGNTKSLIAYFSAEGHTKAVAEAIRRASGADIFFIEPATPYADNPYDDSDKNQGESYNDLRPDVKTFLQLSR